MIAAEIDTHSRRPMGRSMLSVKKILFITSFIPSIAFKVLARVGKASLAQARDMRK